LRFAVSLLAGLIFAAPLSAQDVSCDRGDREVRSLRFVGNTEFTPEVLAATVVTLPSSFAGLPIIGERRCLDPAEFTRDVQRLETLYRRRGFPDIKVDTAVTTLRPGVIAIVFRIAEGQPLRVSGLTVRGVDRDSAVQIAARDFPLKVGGVFDRGALEAGRDTLVKRLRNVGWPQAEALLAYTTNTVARTADVEVTVVPGTRAKIGRIVLLVDSTPTRRRRVSDRTIRRTMGIATGDWYSARGIIEAQRSLYQTDAFQRVELFPDSVQPPGDSTVNLVARLVEGDAWAANGGIGWATLDCFRMQGSLTDRDFLQFAQRLELTARVSKIGIGAPLDGVPSLCQGQARTDPYSKTLNYYTAMTIRQPVRARQLSIPTLTLFSSTLSEYRAFLRRTPIGGAFSLTDPFQTKIPSTIAYQVELGRTEAEPAFYCAVFNVCDSDARNFLQRNSRLAALEYSLVREGANDLFRPTGGSTVRLGVRYASTLIGSDKSQQFTRGTGDFTWYHNLGRGATIVTHVRGGLVFGGSTNPTLSGFIPPQERLYAGGPTTVRGFRQNELGPAVYIVNSFVEKTENGQLYYRADSAARYERLVPTGGNALYVANLEVQVPSPFAPRLLQLAMFTDAGRLWNREGSSQLKTANESNATIKITPGVGVRIVSPFGAIRVDLGYNPYQLPAGSAYYNSPLQAGVAPLYCVSPTNELPIRSPTVSGAPTSQDAGACPATYRPGVRSGLLARLNPSIWIGQAF